MEKRDLRISDYKFGYVYLIKALGYYKIGKAVNVYKRLSSIQTAVPGEIELIAFKGFDSMAVNERYLHNKFKEKRVHGEWFKLGEDDVIYITEYFKTFGSFGVDFNSITKVVEIPQKDTSKCS